jgi:26S proteasome regulatory subunit N9
METAPYLEALEVSLGHIPEAQAEIVKAKQYCLRRHWFEMSEALLRALRFPDVLSIAYDLHKYAIQPSRADFSPFTYSKLLYLIVFSEPEAKDGSKAFEVLDGAAASMVANGHTQGTHCVNCIRALANMTFGAVLEAKRLLDIVSDYVATLQTHEVDSLLLALLYKSRVQEYELGRQYTKFYQTAFDVVNYCERSEMLLLEPEMSALAYKTVIAALLSPETFNFGRLLMFQPFTGRLKDSSDAWLLQWVQLCNDGDVSGFEAFCTVNSEVIRSIPDIAESLPRLQQKVRLMALLHLVFYTPAEQRTFTFQTIAQRCSLSEDSVEELVLSALALKIIEGSIDGLEGLVVVSWVQPRVLSVEEIRELAARLGSWLDVVKNASANVTEYIKMIPE